MHVMVCLDKEMGMMFGKRRQSRDKVVVEDVLALCGEQPLRMNEYSHKLFAEYEKEILVEENFLEQAEEGDFCFVEDQNIEMYQDKIEKLIIYWWNRSYPETLVCNLDLEGWEKESMEEMPGNSHELITREIYHKVSVENGGIEI